MDKDYLKELEYLGLIARLKRLSDNMLYSIRDMYSLKGFEIEPNWHLVFLLLKKHKTRTMTEISDSLGISQPAVVKIINKMKKKGYLEVIVDDKDSRKKQLTLSKKAKKELPDFEKVWDCGQATIQELLEGNESFTRQLDDIEKQLKEESFKERVLRKLN